MPRFTRRPALQVHAVKWLVALAVAVAALAFGVGPATAATAPPYTDPSVVGSLTFENSLKATISGGDIQDDPNFTFAVGTGAANRTVAGVPDDIAQLNICTPNSAVADPSAWVCDQLGHGSNYDPTAGQPTDTWQTGDGLNIGEYIQLEGRQTATSGAYQGLYQIRLVTTQAGQTPSATYYSTPIVVTETGTTTAADGTPEATGTWQVLGGSVSTGPTATSSTISANPSASTINPGTSVTLTAQITPSTAPGSMTFFDGATQLGAAVPLASGTAQFFVSTPTSGSHSYTAQFTPADSTQFEPSTSAAFVQSVASLTTTCISITSDPATSAPVGSEVVLTSTIGTAASGQNCAAGNWTAPPAGTIDFQDSAAGGSDDLGAPDPGSASGTTTITNTKTIASIAAGVHAFSATFTPADLTTYSPASSTPVQLTAGQATVTLSGSPTSPAATGSVITLSARVSPPSAGTLTFYTQVTSGGARTTIGVDPADLTSGTVTQQVTAPTTEGTLIYGVAFAPTSAITVSPDPGIGPTLTYQFLRQATSTSIAVSPAGSSLAGTPVSLSATVSPAAPGYVEFFDGAADLGPATSYDATGSGLATKVVVLGSGAHAFSAQFVPADLTQFAGSFSSAAPYVAVAGGSATVVTSPAASKAPSLKGSVKVGSTVDCSPGTWSGNPTFTYQWLRNGKSIAKATKFTYVPTSSDYKKKLSCTVTAKNSAGKKSATTKATTVAVGAKAAAKKKITVTKKGSVLGLSKTTWTVSGVKVHEQWRRDGKAIAHATSATYRETAADRGHRLSCVLIVTATDHTTATITVNGPIGG